MLVFTQSPFLGGNANDADDQATEKFLAALAELAADKQSCSQLNQN